MKGLVAALSATCDARVAISKERIIDALQREIRQAIPDIPVDDTSRMYEVRAIRVYWSCVQLDVAEIGRLIRMDSEGNTEAVWEAYDEYDTWTHTVPVPDAEGGQPDDPEYWLGVCEAIYARKGEPLNAPVYLAGPARNIVSMRRAQR